jgi:hypothetical protein
MKAVPDQPPVKATRRAALKGALLGAGAMLARSLTVKDVGSRPTSDQVAPGRIQAALPPPSPTSKDAAKSPWITEQLPDGSTRIRAQLHPGQAAAMRSQALTTLMLSGNQSGKTSCGPLWLEREIRRRGPGDYMAITSTYPLLSRKMLPEFLRLFEHTLHLGTWSKGDKIFTYHDGETRVMFGSATNPESLESATAKGAWLDEVGQVQFRLESWEAIQRRLGLNRGRTLMTTTPYNRGFLKIEVYDRAVAGDPDYCVIQFPSTMNPAFPREEAARAERTLPGWKYRMFYLGLFDKPPGMIYGDFSDTYVEQGGHLVHANTTPIPHWWPRFIGLDFGGVNLAKIYLAMDPLSGVFYAYHETLGGGLTTERHVMDTVGDLAGSMLVGAWGGTKNEGAWRLEWTASGLMVMPPPVWDVEIGIDQVISMFKSHKLLIFDTLKRTREELGIYSRPVAADGTVLSGILDKSRFHLLDALRSVALGVKDMAGPQNVLMFGSARGWQPH